MAAAAVSAVIVNRERADLLDACLDSLAAALAEVDGLAETVVVDNGSTDGSAELVRERHPEATLIELGANRGFAVAAQRGIEQSAGEWVLVLNNDATLERGAVRELLAAAADRPDVGSVATQLRFADSPATINSAGLEIDALGVAYDRLLGAATSTGPRAPVEVFGVSAGAALYRRSMLEQLGGFDTSFLVYMEDADLAWRARMAGWRALYAPAAIAEHHHSATSGHGSAFKYFHVGRNRMRMLAKNATSRQLLAHGAGIIAYDLAYVAYVAVRSRTLAPLRGRLAGLREWRRYRAAGARARRPVDLAPVGGIGAALRRAAIYSGRPR